MTWVRFAGLALVPLLLAAYAVPAAAEDISGTIGVTKVIVEDSQLVANVTCTTLTTPCIQFGSPNIALRLWWELLRWSSSWTGAQTNWMRAYL